MRLTILVLDNALIHREADDETGKRWFFYHNMCLLYLTLYSPVLNLIGMVWKKVKYNWRRAIHWSKETLESEPDKLLGVYDVHFVVNFTWLLSVNDKSLTIPTYFMESLIGTVFRKDSVIVLYSNEI